MTGYYLHERKFHKPSGTPVPDRDKIAFWENNIGSAYLRRLCGTVPEVAADIMNLEYDIREEAVEELERSKNVMENSGKDLSQKAQERCRQIVERFVVQHETENFICFYKGYLLKAVWLLEEKTESFIEEKVYCSYLLSLLRKLEHICIRILIGEIQQVKAEGKLEGENSAQEYQYFCRVFLTESKVRHLEEKYPLMYRSICECLDFAAEFYAEALNRLARDRALIIQKICAGKKFERAAQIEGDIADSHRGGKSVLKIQLDNDISIIYKPHALDNEQKFEAFSHLIGEGCSVSMYTVPRICREDYGWVSCVEQKDCTDETEIRRFYERTGIYIFIFYLLGTNDIHGENVIASGEYPVIIDLENIVGMPENIGDSNIMEKVKKYLHTSVLYSGMLPTAKWQQENGSVNISGIGGADKIKMPFKVPKITGGGTSDIRVTYEYPEYTPDQNTPVYQGNNVRPWKYIPEILAGFEKAYRFAADNRMLLEREVSQFQHVKSRFLLADTQRYVMSLNSSYHPALMKEGARRQIYLYTIGYGRKLQEEKIREAVSKEVRDMLQHDIPYFYFLAGEKHLYDSRDEAIGGYFEKTACELILERIRKLDDKDLRQQKRLIRITLNLQKEIPVNRNLQIDCGAKFREPERPAYLDLAGKLMEQILENAIHFEEESGWYSVNVASFGNAGWQIEPMPMFLYSGVSGIALVCHLMEKYTGEERYVKIGEMLDRQLFAYTRQLEKMGLKSLQTGVYNGEMSLVYSYLLMYRITGEMLYLSYAERQAEIVIPAISGEDNVDLLDGLAGIIIGMLLLYEETGDNRYLHAAETAGDRLCGKAVITEAGAGWRQNMGEEILLGISHGNAGIAAALAKLYQASGKEYYIDLFKSAISYEDYYYSEKLGNWIDFRIKDEKVREETDTSAWCHGAGGILASRLMIINKVSGKMKEQVETDIRRAGLKLAEQCLRDGLCLCHGSCGNILLLKEYLRYLQKTALSEQDKKMYQALWQRTKQYDQYITEKLLAEEHPLLIQEELNPGLMNGVSGVIYYLLKCFDETIPNVLTLG